MLRAALLRSHIRKQCRSYVRPTSQVSAEPYGHLPTSQSPITPRMNFINSVTPDGTQIPTYRVLDGVGQLLDGAELPELDEAFARKIYENMVQLPIVDNLMNNVQRQGKISFYMTAHGEEATMIGSAAALANDDEILGQYREMGTLLWRGFGLDNVMAQCFGNHQDTSTKGKQMPVHFSSKEYHFHTISSPLATQVPQAAGVGYAIKRDPNRRGKNCAAVYFGEGAASEGDFHAGMLLASTIPSPTLFIARNNGFAISTPASEQYHGDGIAARGPGYGIDTLRVDGNDVLAVLSGIREARRRCIEQGRGVLVEAMSYRVGHHSTSDDSFAYRPRQEVEDRKRIDNPIARYRKFLEARKWWDEEEEEELKDRLKKDVMKAFKKHETMQRHEVKEMFEDVYGGEMPWNIKEQREELKALLKKYGKDWEPWRSELKKHKGEGKELLEDKSS
ncbi:thiamine diphosphate-binding protein [Cristinia sonorae]|uniref:2-oxoisovalerate dehydrogenase subunit alpha n=1 Tax=Cristinia sonorae TaxID=1940300 RepID=A0A8K0UFJ8_9AGAR|nr:thiamine diphosphate-binding protein [Cristinia sonorae]